MHLNLGATRRKAHDGDGGNAPPTSTAGTGTARDLTTQHSTPDVDSTD